MAQLTAPLLCSTFISARNTVLSVVGNEDGMQSTPLNMARAGLERCVTTPKVGFSGLRGTASVGVLELP